MLEFFYDYVWPVLIVLAQSVLLLVILLIAVAYIIYADRKIWAAVQIRRGPNVVGPWGLLQSFADLLKFILKEPVIPAGANKGIFLLAPLVTCVLALAAWAVIPVAEEWVIADINVGILYIFAISSLGVYGIIMAGWASNSKYPFLGGIRASAQLISYEIAMGLAVLPVFLWTNAPGGTGTLSLVDIVNAQQGLWFAIAQPVSFITFLIALFAETNRLPFDMPESETDLVGGYHTEYSSFKFGFFFVGEYANMAVGSAVVAVVFLGGWHPLPFVTWAGLADSWGLAWLATGVPGALIAFATCFAKMVFMLFFFIWVRWTVPRFRYDQVMRIGWRKLLPVAIGNLVVYAIAITVVDYYDLL